MTIGNKINSNLNPNGTSQTLSFNSGASGTNKGLFLAVTMPNTVNFTGATYNGDAMTLVSNNTSIEGQRVAGFYLQNPANGVNNIVLNFDGSQFNNTSIFAFVVYGADGIDSHGWNDASSTPHSQTLTVSEGAIIYASGLSSNAQSTQYTISGSSRPFEFSHNSNRVVRGALSSTTLGAGSQNITTISDFGTISNFRVAIKPFVTTSRRIIII